MQQRPRKLLLLLVIIILVVIAGWFIYNALTFRVTGTDPGTRSVATVSPFFKINFNKALSSQNLSITANPNIINSFSVSGHSLEIDLNFPLKGNQTDTITIGKIFSVSGKEIINKSFSFQPAYIP